MGKSQLKHTLQPSLDFKTKKKKLGRKPLPDPNLTITTFKSKTLYIPGQSIEGKEDELTNYRNQTLKDLLSKFKHYSEQVRKDSVLGLRDLIKKYPIIVETHTSSIVNKLFEVVNDEYKDVRAAAHQVFPILFPLVDQVMMTPFMPLFLVYVCAGMTHLRTSIRLDALKLFEMLMERYPGIIAQHAHQLVPNYVDIMKRVGMTNSTSVVLAGTGNRAPNSVASTKTFVLSARIQVLKSMYKLLQILISRPDHTYQVLLSKNNTSNSYNGNNPNTFSWEDALVNINNNFNNYHNYTTLNNVYTSHSIQSIRSISTETGSAKDGENTGVTIKPTILKTSHEILDLLVVLMPILVDCWLEMSPNTLMVSFSSLEDQLLVIDTLNLLVGGLVNHPKRKEIESIRDDFIKYFGPRFPFEVGSSTNPDSREWVISTQINCTMVQIMKHFMGSHPTSLEPSFDRYLEYIENGLEGLLIDETKVTGHGQAVRTHLSNILWVVTDILPLLKPEKQNDILQSFMKFEGKCHHHSGSKKACVFFIKQLIELNSKISKQDKTMKSIVDWGLTSLPKLLWKLGNNDPNTSLMIINILKSFGKDNHKKQQYESIQNALVPFFFTIIKPNEKFPKGKQVYGPFITLPIYVQIEAINMLYYFKQFGMLIIRSLIGLSRSPKVSNQVLDILFDIIDCKREEFGLQNYLAFSMAIVFSITSSPKDEEEEQEENEVEQVTEDGKTLKRKHSEITEESKSEQEKEQLLDRLCRNMNNLRTKIDLQKILEPISSKLVTELTKQKDNITSNKYLLQFIYSCFSQTISDEWKSLPQTLSEQLPTILFNYIFNVMQSNDIVDRSSYLLQLTLFIKSDNSNSLFKYILNQLKEKIIKDKQITIVSNILIGMIKEKQMESTLIEMKNNILELVNVLQSNAKEMVDKQVVDKLQSECKTLFFTL